MERLERSDKAACAPASRQVRLLVVEGGRGRQQICRLAWSLPFASDAAAIIVQHPQTLQEVMASMYGRLDPKPAPPSYSAEERQAVEARQAAERREARRLTPQAKAWLAITIPPQLGLHCRRYKWRQNQSHVEVFVQLHPRLSAKRVSVQLAPKSLRITTDAGSDAVTLLGGELLHEVVHASEHTHWLIDEQVVHISLLKRHRRGHYFPGGTNADTFWTSLFAAAGAEETLTVKAPPADYYFSPYEADDLQVQALPAAGPAVRRQVGSSS